MACMKTTNFLSSQIIPYFIYFATAKISRGLLLATNLDDQSKLWLNGANSYSKTLFQTVCCLCSMWFTSNAYATNFVK